MKKIYFSIFLFLFFWNNFLIAAERIPSILPAKPRIVAIGDVHGDYLAARKAILLTGLMNEKNHWIGNDSILVQVGDQLDRGDGERRIIHLLENLAKEASKKGGAVYVLNGNHETMNVDLDFRYVTIKGAKAFSSFFKRNTPIDATLAKIPDHLKGRAIAFRPGGEYAKLLAGHNTVLIIGDTLFVHGGISPKYAQYGINKINTQIAQWMKNEISRPSFINDSNGPLWNRQFSMDTSAHDCRQLEKVLAILKIKRMVVAHTVQEKGINSTCNKQVWRIDTGLSAHYGGKLEVLEILDNKTINIIRNKI